MKRTLCHIYCVWIKVCRRPSGPTMANRRKRIGFQPPNVLPSAWIRCCRTLLWIVRICAMKSSRIKWKRWTPSPTWSNRIEKVAHCRQSICAKQPYRFYLAWVGRWDAMHTIHRRCCAEYIRPSKFPSWPIHRKRIRIRFISNASRVCHNSGR